MSVLWRVLSLAALVLSGGILVFSIISVRKEQRVRPGLDLFRLAITLLTTGLMARFLGVATPEALMGVGFLVGLLVGLYEGLHLKVRFLGKRTFARRTILGIAAWGAGLVIVQAAGVIGRAGMADFGLALSFLGIGQVIGLLTGRWQSVVEARRAPGGAFAGAVLLMAALAAALLAGWGLPARAAAAADVRAVMAGDVPGVAVEVRGNGEFYGLALSLTFTNETDAEVEVVVPLGLQFVPDNEAVQTMIAAGAETITVPPTGGGAPYATEIQAFCGQYPDDIPSAEDVFSAGEVASGDQAAVIALINEGGTFGRDQQEAVWHLTDGYDISANTVAGDLVGAAGQGSNALCPCTVFSAGEGTRTAFLGLGGAALLLFSALLEGGNSLASVAGSWRSGGWRGLRDLTSGISGAGFPAPEWRDPGLELAGGRAAAALDGLPAPVRTEAEGTLLRRLEAEQTDRFAEAVRAAVGPLAAAADPAQVLASNSKAVGLLDRLPAEVRSRLEEKVLGGIREERLAGVVEKASRALRRDRALEVLRGAIEHRDGPAARSILSAVGEGDAEAVWREASAGMELKAAALEYPPPGAPAVPPNEVLDLASHLDVEGDLKAVLHRGGQVEAVLASLPEDVRAEAEGRLVERLDAERLGRWVEKLRGAVASVEPGPAAGSVLDAAEAQRLLESLPAGLRERVEEHAARVLDGELVQRLVDDARRAIERKQAVDLLRTAFRLGDGDTADAVLDAVGAALDVVEEADVDRLVRQATGGGAEGLAALSRHGGAVPPVDLTEHLLGEADLLAAVRRVEGVEAVLGKVGSGLRSQVEAALVETLDADRVGRVVRKAAEVVGPEGRAASDVMEAVRELPAVRDLLSRLAKGARAEAYELLGEHLEGQRLEGAVEEVSRALSLDRAEEALRQAARAGDIDAVDRILGSLPSETAREIAGKALDEG
jgi:hypothetical protein